MSHTIMHEWFDEVWNRGHREAVHRLLAPNAVIHNLDEHGVDSRGPDEFLAFWTRLRGAFPVTHVTVDDTIEDSTKIAGRWTVTGTHLGDQLGSPPTAGVLKSVV